MKKIYIGLGVFFIISFMIILYLFFKLDNESMEIMIYFFMAYIGIRVILTPLIIFAGIRKRELNEDDKE